MVCGSNLVGEVMRHSGDVGLIWWVSVLVDFGCFLSVVLVLSRWFLGGLGLFGGSQWVLSTKINSDCNDGFLGGLFRFFGR